MTADIVRTLWLNLRAYNDADGPDELTALLGIEPSRAFAKGAILESGIAPKNGWFLESSEEVDSRKFVEHLTYILAQLSSARDGYEEAKKRGWSFDLQAFVAVPPANSIGLRPDLMRTLVDLDLVLGIFFGSAEQSTAV